MKDEEIRHGFVPANDGWFIAEPVWGLDGAVVDYLLHPIIAWSVVVDGELGTKSSGKWAEPVLYSPSLDDDSYPIVTPDGWWVFVEDGDFEPSGETGSRYSAEGFKHLKKIHSRKKTT